MQRRLALLVLAIAVAAAAPPVSLADAPLEIAYQGRLLDSTGKPLAGPVNIEIAIWDAPAGGVELYREVHASVLLSNGLFEIRLGKGLFPSTSFDATLFSGPSRWLEVVVDAGTGGEQLVPRQAFGSVAFALESQHAADAELVGGIAAAQLDQSAHVADLGNPHGVTAAQVGAATTAALDAHVGDAGNPHAVTAAQVGAATPTTVNSAIASHAVLPSAHHAKTTTFPELSGQISNAQIPSAIARDTEVTANDAGRSGVEYNLFEGTQTLSVLYLNAVGPEVITSNSSRTLEVVSTGPGEALLARSTQDDGVIGVTSASNKSGVFGRSDFGVGVTGRSTAKSGVLGVATSTSLNAAGVEARNEGGFGPAIIAQGDLFVTGGEYRGNLGPNGGAPFPKPAYDSGWVAIAPLQNLVLQHGVGGDVDDYVVDFQQRDLSGCLIGFPPIGIHNKYVGKDSLYIPGDISQDYGAYWHDLKSSEISVERARDDCETGEVRVRIWRTE